MNIGSDFFLPLFYFLLNLNDSFRDFLEGLVFLVVEDLLCFGNTLEFVFDVRIPLDSLRLLKVLHISLNVCGS